ncbi:hypothetical protein C7S14_3074 [Burkholderia cepacia]|nr:hypothetical protein C7S14_3074 [Burkholderia cepacia]
MRRQVLPVARRDFFDRGPADSLPAPSSARDRSYVEGL